MLYGLRVDWTNEDGRINGHLLIDGDGGVVYLRRQDVGDLMVILDGQRGSEKGRLLDSWEDWFGLPHMVV